MRYYLDEKAKNLNFAKAEVLFKPRYSWFNTDKKEAEDRTAPDLLVLFPDDILIAIEAKYTLPIQRSNPGHLTHQFQREFEPLQTLKRFDVKDRYLFLLMTHQRLDSHIQSRDEGFRLLRKYLESCGDKFRVNTWNCVYHTVQKMKNEDIPEKEKILAFFKQKKNYMTNSSDGRKSNLVKMVSDKNDNFILKRWDQWRDLILKNEDTVPPNTSGQHIPKTPIKRRNGVNLKDRFLGKNKIVFDRVVELAAERKYYPDPRAEYINFPFPGGSSPVAFQIHQHKENEHVLLAIPDADEKCPSAEPPSIYQVSEFSEVSGYVGWNRPWLNGYGNRWPHKRARVLGLHESMANDLNSVAWQNVAELLEYTLRM